MSLDGSILLETLRITTPLIGVYDAPDPAAFEPLVDPGTAPRVCLFSFFQSWLDGKTLHLTRQRHGCRGCGYWLFGEEFRTREEFVRFLVDDEGLKASHELMRSWLDERKPYHPAHEHLFIGPLRKEQQAYLKTVTFFVNPDQLSALLLAAQYRAPEEPPPVAAPFGSGCMQLLPLLENEGMPPAVIGATDIAMRQHLPAEMLAFSVTPALFSQISSLGEESFLGKPFWRRLTQARDAGAS